VIVPNPIEVATRIERKNQYQLRLKLYSPFDGEVALVSSRPSYELTRGQQTFTLSGTSFSGAALRFSREWGNWRTHMDVLSISGKAFSSLGYQDQKLSLYSMRAWDLGMSLPLWAGAGLSYARLSSYKRAEFSNELSAETLSEIGIVAKVHIDPWVWEKNFIRLEAEILAPKRLSVAVALKHYFNNYFWGFGLEQTSLEKDSSEISATTIQLQFGYRWQRHKN